MTSPLTNGTSLSQWKLVSYCRQVCNAPTGRSDGHFERDAEGTWMLAADVLPALESLRSQLTAEKEELRRVNELLERTAAKANKLESSATASEKQAEEWTWLKGHPDELACAVEDAYGGWDGDDVAQFGELLTDEIKYQRAKV